MCVDGITICWVNNPVDALPHALPQRPSLEQEGGEEPQQNFPRVNCRPVVSSPELATSSERGPESDPDRRLRGGLTSVGSQQPRRPEPALSQINPRMAAAGFRQQISRSHFWSGSTSLLHESHGRPLCTPEETDSSFSAAARRVSVEGGEALKTNLPGTPAHLGPQN